MRKGTICIVLAILTALLVHSSLAAPEKRAITQEDLEWMVQNRPVIIQGQVTSVEVKLMDGEILYGKGIARGRQLPATEVTLKIDRMIAGDYDGKEIGIILLQGTAGGIISYDGNHAPLKVNVGDSAIVGIWINERGTGCNILDNTTDIFKVQGTSLVPYREEYYLAVDKPLEVIARKAKEREMPEIFKAADLVCTATVTKLIDLDKPSRQIVVSIDEPLKGTSQKSEVTVDMSDVYLPSALRNPGYRVVLFLKKDNCGYRPVAGVNGYYLIEGDKLSRGHGLPLRTSVSQLKNNIRAWKETSR